MAGGMLLPSGRARRLYAVALTCAKASHLSSSEGVPGGSLYGSPPSREQLDSSTHLKPAIYSPGLLPNVALHNTPASEISAAVRSLCGWLCEQMLRRPLYLTPPRIFSPQRRGLLSSTIQREALSSAVCPVTARSQRAKSSELEETQAMRKKEHLEGQGDGQFEQEEGGPLRDRALGDTTRGSCVEEEVWTRGHSADTVSGGRQGEVAEGAPIMEALGEMFPNRRHISPATDTFVQTLLGMGLTEPQVCKMFAQNTRLFARSSGAFLERRELLARHGVGAAAFLALLRRQTWWLSKPLQEVEGTILYVESLLGGPGETAARVFTLSPHLLSCSAGSLEEKVQALRRAGVRDVARVITRYPNVLSHHTAQDIAGKIAALKVALGEEQPTALLERHPQVLRANTGVLCALLAWLEKAFGRAAALGMVAREPRVMHAKVETASDTYASLGGAFGEERARCMLLSRPGLLARKWCTLEAKVDFLTEELGHGLDGVASCPWVLNMSLEGRMRPRAAALRAAGKAYGSLSSLLWCSDEQFERAYGVRLRRAAAAASSEAETLQGRREEIQPHLGSTR